MCLKCIGSRKDCVYFRSPPPASAIRRSLCPAPVLGTPQELSLSRYFVGNVITFLADEFNGDFFRYSLPQVMHNAEPIWHGSNAIASLALSHKAVHGSTPGGSAKESTRQYSMSMKYILDITKAPSITPKNKTIVLLANVLFGIYALFTGDTVANMVLHEKTRRLIRHWKFWECTEISSVSTLSMQLLHHFLKSNTLMQEALLITPQHPRQTWVEAIVWFQKRPMATVLQAYVEFEMLWVSMRVTLDSLPLKPSKLDILVATATRTELRRQFDSWERRYQILKSTLPKGCLQISILKIRSILIHILFKVDLDCSERLWDETCWDTFWPQFSEAFRLLETTLEKEMAAPRKAEFDTQFTPSLYKALNFIARMCRQPELRRKAIALLRRSLTVAMERVSNVSGNNVLEFISDQIIEVEEGAWGEGGAEAECDEGSKCVKDKFICKMHRIIRVLAPDELPERVIDYTILTTWDVLNRRAGQNGSVRAVFFS